MDLEKLGEEQMPSITNNPFKKSSIISINVDYSQSLFDHDKWSAYGNIKFKNGNTEGNQKFRGDSFDNVVAQIKNYINKELK
jgi:hypothetical protein